jgi:riboflavin synthase
MFTGIIEEIGKIKQVIPYQHLVRLTIESEKVLADMQLGGSIAVDGACLTVIEFNSREFTVELGAETLKITTLGGLISGDRVNLERPLRVTDRLGGHFLQGHVDGIGILEEKISAEGGFWLWFKAPFPLMKYIVPKGYIGVDGISLTAVEIRETEFSIFLIPYTAEVTTLGLKNNGDQVNLEFDIIGKYIEKLISPKVNSKPAIDVDFLKEHGFN